MIKFLLIGHRGSGKSRLLEKIERDFSGRLQTVSLDAAIVEKYKTDIKRIFSEKGEAYFRKIEQDTFNDIVKKFENASVIVDVGAGFLGEKPKGWKALWVQRSIDLSKALFLDRPALDQGLHISSERFHERERRYRAMADYQIELREGFFDGGLQKDYLEVLFFNEKKPLLQNPWWVTILDDDHASNLSYLDQLGPVRYELRDDLLSEKTFGTLFSQKPDALVSLRDPNRKSHSLSLLKKDTLWDWPLEWGMNDEASILSLHQRADDFSETLKSLPMTKQTLKLAVPVANFAELMLGWNWQIEDPENRIFLPRSSQGRWGWYRLLTALNAPLRFLREGKGSSSDQPSLLEVISHQYSNRQFGAILGSPVKHSLTPAFHEAYFRSVDANVLRIDLPADDFGLAFPFLTQLGLKYAAVTSPLKIKAAELIDVPWPSINSLFIQDGRIEAANTDIDGFKKLLEGLENKKVAVWGGGGTHEAINQCLPQASYYSSRRGELKQGPPLKDPEVIVWAVGAEAFESDGQWPPPHWNLEAVVDLNYAIDSPGMACALRYGCQYRSGLVMFTTQAQKQQEFWNECRLK